MPNWLNMGMWRMFNGNRNREDRAASGGSTAQANARRGQFSVLGADIVITGNLVATSDLHIDGRIEGDVRCGSLVQGAESQIFGRVEAEDARLAGSVEGSVRARQLTIERTARVTGDVEYETIMVEQGGHIDGRLKHIGGTTATVAPPVLIKASEEAA
nr:polymer-forming cytoskeletal protein [uncultured Sphingomonas sp.]